MERFKMKRLVLVGCVGLGLLLSGCATDGAYNIGKAAYKTGKVVVKELPLKSSTMSKLGTVDKVATTYDKARGILKEQLEGNDQDVATLPATQD